MSQKYFVVANSLSLIYYYRHRFIKGFFEGGEELVYVII